MLEENGASQWLKKMLNSLVRLVTAIMDDNCALDLLAVIFPATAQLKVDLAEMGLELQPVKLTSERAYSWWERSQSSWITTPYVVLQF